MSQLGMILIEGKMKSSEGSTSNLRNATTSSIFRYLPRSRHKKGQPPFVEDISEIQLQRLENEGLHILKEDMIILILNL